jgi:hypothetical protein
VQVRKTKFRLFFFAFTLNNPHCLTAISFFLLLFGQELSKPYVFRHPISNPLAFQRINRSDSFLGVPFEKARKKVPKVIIQNSVFKAFAEVLNGGQL